MTAITRTRTASLEDWDKAYNNRAAVGMAEVEAFIADLEARAKAFRQQMTGLGRTRLDEAYGDRPRQHFDLFLPDQRPAALTVFVHGGYWRSFDKSFWSHLASGPLAHQAAVAIPSYTLCPEARISDITNEIARFLGHIAAEVDGPIRLVGHSAGGHLVARLASSSVPHRPGNAPDRRLSERIAKIVSISGVHDLRPLLLTSMNDDLRLDLAEARAESPILLDPVDGVDLTCWAGADELPAFRLQNRLLAEIWGALGARTEAVEAKGKHHFSVIDDLADPESELVGTLMGQSRDAGES
ncbi:MAG: alpha/beta hydrolase [Geminicoccaceae bacterium]